MNHFPSMLSSRTSTMSPFLRDRGESSGESGGGWKFSLIMYCVCVGECVCECECVSVCVCG